MASSRTHKKKVKPCFIAFSTCRCDSTNCLKKRQSMFFSRNLNNLLLIYSRGASKIVAIIPSATENSYL
jgi:hypothetical protein